MVQVLAFDGGLSTRVDASLILENEAVQYSNIDSTSLKLVSAKDVTVTSQLVGGYFYNYANTWLSSTAPRSYVEYKNFVYYTEQDKAPKKYNGVRETLLGIVAPVTALVTVQIDPPGSEEISPDAETLQYTYTYYNSQDGIESAPAPISTELSLAALKAVSVSNLVASTDPQVDKIRIYRLGAGTTSMTLIEELPNVNQVYLDDTPTLDLEGTLLETVDNQVPENGVQFLVEAYGILFAAKGDKVYFSKVGLPDYWPAQYFLDFSADITGLLPIDEGILVFTASRTEIILGTTPENFVKSPISTEQGCTSHFSLKIAKAIPLWTSNDGICTYSAGKVEVLSKDKLGKRTFNVVNSAVYDEIYYLCLQDGSLFAFDLRYNSSFKEFVFSEAISNILVYNDTLYARCGDYLSTVFTGDDLYLTYKSPNFTEGAHTITKAYNNVYLRANGEFEITIYIDGKEVMFKAIHGDKVFDVKPPQELQRGTSIQFLITGIGTIYEYEYKVLGRENGR